ncbi:MAG TPA: X-Pro aminopeptidase, partial [Parvularcula sp.]|nr:X-Pro aminopeptidase [Parvularcula sp.]HBS32497.1 X-Pro aminopeptidase [Parvularcula sp.]
MFQHFDPVSDRSFAAKHLPLLRAEMKALKIDGFIVPHDDEYQNEYIPAYAERLMWASGFSGSAGAAIVFLDKAVIFVDGRYTLQVRQQVDDKHYLYADLVETPPDQWLAENAAKGAAVGYDPMLHTKAGVERLEKAAATRGFTLVALDRNPIDAAWRDQP